MERKQGSSFVKENNKKVNKHSKINQGRTKARTKNRGRNRHRDQGNWTIKENEGRSGKRGSTCRYQECGENSRGKQKSKIVQKKTEREEERR